MSDNIEENEKPHKSGHWSKEEHNKFLEGIQKYGKNWKKIVDCVGTRSSNQVRSHAQKYFLQLERKKNLPTYQPAPSDDALSIYLQTLTYKAYVSFINELRKLYLTRPVKVLRQDSGGTETISEDRTRKIPRVA